MSAPTNITPVYVAGNATVHAGRKIGTYASGADRYMKLCGTTRTTRHDPSPVGPDAEITCKRCLAKLAARAAQTERKAALEAETFPVLPEPESTRDAVREMYPHGRYVPLSERESEHIV